MKIAIVGSRDLKDVALDQYISEDAKEIVSGGAAGVDFCAAQFAKRKGLKLTEFLPQYERYGRAAPIIRKIHFEKLFARYLNFFSLGAIMLY